MRSCETCLRGHNRNLQYGSPCHRCGDDLNLYLPLRYKDEEEEPLTLDKWKLEVVKEIQRKDRSDPIVESVREKLLTRSKSGIEKYGTRLDRKDLKTVDWLIHAQEEALDLANYLEILIQDARSKSD